MMARTAVVLPQPEFADEADDVALGHLEGRAVDRARHAVARGVMDLQRPRLESIIGRAASA